MLGGYRKETCEKKLVSSRYLQSVKLITFPRVWDMSWREPRLDFDCDHLWDRDIPEVISASESGVWIRT
jgi:hypothetical protein